MNFLFLIKSDVVILFCSALADVAWLDQWKQFSVSRSHLTNKRMDGLDIQPFDPIKRKQVNQADLFEKSI